MLSAYTEAMNGTCLKFTTAIPPTSEAVFLFSPSTGDPKK